MTLGSLLLARRAADLSSFFSLYYMVLFLPVTILVYTIVPAEKKRFALLGMSYVFFWLISGKLIVYLLLMTFAMHYFGLWLDRLKQREHALIQEAERQEKKAIRAREQKRQRGVVLLGVALMLGTLLFLKYSAFFTLNVNALLKLVHSSLHLEVPNYLLPIGISFFTLQAISYLLDVYRGVIEADESLSRLALFLGFFPQIVEGPICRYQKTARQLYEAEPIRYENLVLGMERFLYGMLKKIVVADRLNPLVSNVFTRYESFDGGIIAVAAVCYTVQLYMDFSGSMDAVIGTAQIFGIELPENFKRPFFSRTISEFWRRWHITLGEWFKDYVFYPLTTTKRLKNLTKRLRKRVGVHFASLAAGSVALFCVWFGNGLWHGAAWNYIFFGMYHFVLILIGNIIAPAVRTVNERLNICSDAFWYRLLQMLRTAVLVVIGELFFRANGLRSGLAMFRTMVTDFTLASFRAEVLPKLGIDSKDVAIVLFTVGIVWVVSMLNERGISIREKLAGQRAIVRWPAIYITILFVVIFGAYGVGYMPVDPMYAQF
jgi:alginate O-acetyltransferase complex protein AlgI